MTYRERREAKAARYREWADKREEKAAEAYDKTRQIADMIPLGQPIIVGHYSEGRARRDQDRMHRGMGKAIEHSDKAESMRSKAGNIEAALDESIYSDDPDAIERLEAKIAANEDKRTRIKAYNAACRKGTADRSIFTAAELDEWWIKPSDPDKPLAAYVLSNLGGVINKDRKRLEGLKRKQARSDD